MKLKRFDTSNATTALRSGKPAITFQANGSITMNRHAMELLNLTPKQSRIALHQDEESRKDWYIEMVSDDRGLMVRGKKEGGTFASISICREIWKAYGMQAATIRLNINPNQKQLAGLKLFEIMSPDYEKAIESL
ncbi:hypothetical protein [uncultured Draconibacterium sp.]|uniref:hypothetical protein n=1 Tax=uncultured Draconibacterium sp. TaxID=1573823 RepID=UPI003260FEFD